MNEPAPHYPNIDRAVHLLDAILGLAFALVKLVLWVCFLVLVVGLWVQIMS